MNWLCEMVTKISAVRDERKQKANANLSEHRKVMDEITEVTRLLREHNVSENLSKAIRGDDKL